MDFLNIETKCVYSHVKNYFKNSKNQDPAHGLDHLIRVYKNGMLISNNKEINFKILEPSLLLHDIVKPLGKNKVLNLTLKKSKEILSNCKYNSEQIREILYTIETHSRSDLRIKPKTLEGKIVYDADKIDGVGQIGINRVKKMGKKLNWTEQKMATWYKKRILDVVENEPFYFKKSKKIANQRIDLSLEWCEKILLKKT